MAKLIRLSTFLIILLPLWGFAQGDYWQQEVRYLIDVRLDDTDHSISGTIGIQYTNHSPDTLDRIYLHLWGNAFQDQTTAFARQQLRNGNTAFYFASPEDLGGYSGLDFSVDGNRARWQLDDQHPDIGILFPDQPLGPGATITISTPFTLKLPASFSRPGHVGESYQVTQWFPKPAVYDAAGWHPMPYLDMGEFYSEFGTFDVSITLPANYVVAATGILQTESERKFLAEKAAATTDYLANLSGERNFNDEEPFPPSDPDLKTIRYTAARVHDFAWFADKRFKVQKSGVTLPSGRRVDTWVFFNEYEEHLWQKAIDYVDRSVQFFSELVGEYPYPQATAVQSALSAGAGMEYPMITVIGPSYTGEALDEVITHEVGHNWFYGILASNERDHPWMDEGITTYYEQRYLQEHYGKSPIDDYLPKFLTGHTSMSLYELGYLYQARRHLDQAPDTPSDEFSELNYFLGAYQKPGAAFGLLEHYLGRDTFDRAMQAYYRLWQFRHPQPADLRRLLESETGQNLEWLFGGLIGSNEKVNYGLKRLRQRDGKYEIIVKNKGRIASPFTLSGIRDGEVVEEQFYDGFAGKDTLDFPAGNYDRITLDAGHLSPELYRQDNHRRTRGMFPGIEPLQLNIIPRLEDDQRSQLFFFPVPAWNNYDKFMLGLLLYNTTVPARRFEFSILPMYGFGSKDLVGTGKLQYHFYPHGPALQRVTLGLGIKSHNFFRQAERDYQLQYARLMPFLQVELGKKPAATFTQILQWRTLWLQQEKANFPGGEFMGTDWTGTFIHELSYSGENRRALHPFRYRLALEQQSYTDTGGDQQYLKASLEWNGAFHYREKRRIDFRIFTGGFLTNSRRSDGAIFPGAFNLVGQGFNDYRFDDSYLGRTENSGIWSQQISLRDGGLKNALGSAYSLGRSNNFIIAFNLKADLPVNLPLRLPLKPYFDMGYFDNAQPTGQDDTFQDQFLWSLGLALDFFDGMAGIYFPLLNSKNIQDRYAERGNYWTRVTFSIDLQRWNPFELVKRIEF